MNEQAPLELQHAPGQGAVEHVPPIHVPLVQAACVVKLQALVVLLQHAPAHGLGEHEAVDQVPLQADCVVIVQALVDVLQQAPVWAGAGLALASRNAARRSGIHARSRMPTRLAPATRRQPHPQSLDGSISIPLAIPNHNPRHFRRETAEVQHPWLARHAAPLRLRSWPQGRYGRRPRPVVLAFPSVRPSDRLACHTTRSTSTSKESGGVRVLARRPEPLAPRAKPSKALRNEIALDQSTRS